MKRMYTTEEVVDERMKALDPTEGKEDHKDLTWYQTFLDPKYRNAAYMGCALSVF